MIFWEDHGRRHVWRHVRSRVEVAIDGITPSIGHFLRSIRQSNSPNAWRILIGAEILWGRLSRGNRQLTLDEFFWCYTPQHISSSKGIYHFVARKKSLTLVSNMPNSNRNWKSRYFFCLRDGLGMPSRRVGDDASWLWQYLGHHKRFKFSTVYILTFYLFVCFKCLTLSAFSHFQLAFVHT